MGLKADWLVGEAAISGEVADFWDTVHNMDPALPFALSRDFSSLVTEAFQPPTVPVSLLISDSGAPVALWPLAFRRDPHWGWGVRRAMHRNEWHTVISDPLIVGGPNPGLSKFLFDSLITDCPVDLVDIWRINRNAMPPDPAGIAESTPSSSVIHDRPLPPWSRNRRRSFSRGRRKFEALPGAIVEERSCYEAVLESAREFVVLHTKLKRYQHQWTMFEDIAGAADRFPGAFARRSSAGRASILRLAAGRRTLGLTLILHRGGTSTAWRSAWDPDFAHLGVGLLLNDEAVRRSRERGDAVHELGSGVEAYKRLWANHLGEVVRLRHVRSTVRLMLARASAKVIRSSRRTNHDHEQI
jgi:hypothetical protein